MNFLKRALLSIWGHKGRTIILFITFAVIGSMLLMSLAISAASKNVKQSVNSNIGCQIRISHKSYSYKQYTGVKDSFGVLVQRDYENSVAKVPHVTFVNHIVNYYQYAESFNITPDADTTTDSTIPELKVGESIAYSIIVQMVTDSSKLTQFSTGNYKLVAGRHLNKSDTGKKNVLINEKTAKDNNLKISDQITTYRKNAYNKKFDCTYTIVGIFSAPIYDFEKDNLNVYTDPGKLIYTSDNSNVILGETDAGVIDQQRKQKDSFKKILEECNSKPENSLTFTERFYKAYIPAWTIAEKKDPNILNSSVEDMKRAQFLVAFVDSPENLQAVISRLKNLKDGNLYYFQTNQKLYSRITKPVSIAEKLSSMFAYIVFGAGLLIMVLIVMLSFRGRKHEFGILLSVGEKKSKIVLQILIETLIPVLLSFIVVFSVSGIAAQKAGDAILQKNYAPVNQTESIMTQRQYEMDNAAFNVNNVDQISKIDVKINSYEVFVFAGCSLLIVLLATEIPMIKIVKLSPMKVLMKKE